MGMDITRTAFGAWNGGRFMNFGEPLADERWINLVRHAFSQGIRTFITADVYGAGAADELLAKSLAGIPRGDYCLVGAIGHDFYKAQRQGSRGYPRFTDPAAAWKNSMCCCCTIPIPPATAATASGRA
jgi:aryl-alcohol dehydrogenase-like predicted oxidoreductase